MHIYTRTNSHMRKVIRSKIYNYVDNNKIVLQSQKILHNMSIINNTSSLVYTFKGLFPDIEFRNAFNKWFTNFKQHLR